MGFFSDMNAWLQGVREGLRLEKVECTESEGKYQLGLYFNQPIYPMDTSQMKETDGLQQFYNDMYFLGRTAEADADPGSPPWYPEVETALNTDRTAMGVRGPKKDVLELLRSTVNVALSRTSSLEDPYQGIDRLQPGHVVHSDEDLQILKATGKLPATEGRRP
jgi:hypothetical protein